MGNFIDFMKKIILALTSVLLPFIAFEYIYRTRDKKSIEPLTSERTPWIVLSSSDNEKVYETTLSFRNFNSKYEGTLASLSSSIQVLFKKEHLDDITVETKLIPADYTKPDGYVSAFLMSPSSNHEVRVQVKVKGNLESIKKVQAMVIRINYSVYDRVGYSPNKLTDIIFVPAEEEVTQNFNALQEQGATIYPVKTHLLSDGDDLSEVIKKYAGNFLQEGDIVVLAESPVAITEGRFKHPSNVKLSWWAKRLCYFVPSVGSLSSPYGMQCAIDQIGVPRFVGAMFAGAVMKVLGKNGWFYTLAGMESELIDDLTGTIAPYDKYIVLGPKDSQKTVEEIKQKLGVDVAIADANDLKKARILASTLSDSDQIRQWMLNNPAGNSAEQTPIVIIRPSK